MRKFDPTVHIRNLIYDPYYVDLIKFRNALSNTIDKYFQGIHAPKVDLYMVTNSVSSPMGKGSDSIPWPIQMGNKQTHLADSAQFGMEPLVQAEFKAVYCYLPSFRGEKPDDQHMNQFYHCEAEIRGDIQDCINIAEGLFYATLSILDDPDLISFIPVERIALLKEIRQKSIVQVDYKKALDMLGDHPDLIEKTSYGTKITRKGEIALLNKLNDSAAPAWLTGFDRDLVPFYQKPDPNDPERVLNADLLLPSLNGVGFAGEVLGAGQRQDTAAEIRESIARQGVQDGDNYEWYIDMRDNPTYRPTSGFGLGIERYISWLVGTEDIASVAIYPVLNNVKTQY